MGMWISVSSARITRLLTAKSRSASFWNRLLQNFPCLPFSWSTSERMSTQQADILTSELEYYRRILTPVIRKICRIYLRLRGLEGEPQVEWDNINMQDEVELAKARLYNAQAENVLRTE